MSRQEYVFSHLDRLRKAYIRGRCLEAVLLGLAVCSGFLLVSTYLDLFLRLHQAFCWLLWGLFLGLIGYAVFRCVRRARQRVSNQAIAVLVEEVIPELDEHLINAVQFAERDSDNAPFVEELLAETDADLSATSGRQLFSQRPLVWSLKALAGFAVAALIGIAVTPRGMSHAIRRILTPMAGVRPYTLTRILDVSPGNTTVLRGETLPIKARFEGRLPDEAFVIWQRARGKTEEIKLESGGTDPAAGALPKGECLLKGVFTDCSYRVVAGDAKSPWFRVTVTNPPGLEQWQAKIFPPDYVGKDPFKLDSNSPDMSVPANSEVLLAGAATDGIESASVVQDDLPPATKNTVGRAKFAIRFKARDRGAIRLVLKAENGLEATTTLPLAIVPDQRPGVVLIDTKQRIMAAANAQVPVSFKAQDDYGITRIGFERIVDENATEEVSVVEAETRPKTFPGRFLVDLPSFGAREGDKLRFRVWAEDTGPERLKRRGFSPEIQIVVPVLEDRRKARKKMASEAKKGLLALVKMQRENLKNTRHLAEIVMLGREIKNARIQDLSIAQKNIREMAIGLLENRAALGDLATVLGGLINHEMAGVLQLFEEAHRVSGDELSQKLNECVKLETRILAALTGIPSGMANEEQHQEKSDLFAALQKIVAAQRRNLKDSKAAQKGDFAPDTLPALVGIQDGIANDTVSFTDQCLVMIEERVDDEFATQIRQVYDLLENGGVYEKSLAASEALEEADLAVAIQNEEEVLKSLMQALNILNVWRMKNAQKIVKEATEVLRKTAEALGQLEAKQTKIAEVTRDLTQRGKLDDELRDKLREMDEEQKDMAKLIEELANDLYQFPELPVCNELNSKMREIYEDVEQAMESENAPSKEIAVQKEDSLLDAIRNTKERVEDVEMWLPDIPDNIVWNMESFDTDEFPEIPLVPLPDELEDIVGELLDQASDIDAQSQDTTGNNIIADMEMGWGVADGPMPSFSAKGKSGNTRPNDNEMTGRSGAGREGQANGELVENHVKGLEGRATHARRTQDPFQKGMVTEDENSTMDARATGGGKLGGESETIGMFGKAPRRDLQTAAHGRAMKLRQETEALYATARLLYLGTGGLGSAARELRGIEEGKNRMASLGSLHRRVLRRLEDTQVEMNSGVVLPMPVASVSRTGGAVTGDMDISKISEEYRDIVGDYYRSLDAGD